MPKGAPAYSLDRDAVETALFLKGMSKRHASMRIGLDQHALGKVLRGDRTMAMPVVQKLCVLLDMKEEDVLFPTRVEQDAAIAEWHFKRQTACGRGNAARFRDWSASQSDE
jgi:hypothetical protein